MMKIRTYRVLSSSRLGYRGAFLLWLALVDFVYGWFLINPTDEQLQTTQFVWRDHIMATQGWGAIWLGAGVVLTITAFMKQDRVGYAVAIALKFSWAFIAIMAGLTGHVQGAWTTVTIWGVFGGLTVMESGRPEPLHTHEVTIINESDDE
jgi:hypothetical protein